MQFAKINDVTLHYQLLGAPEGKPTLVFVNSLGTDFRIWRDVIVGMAGEAAMIAYDKRGHGLSDIGKTYPYSMDDHVGDLAGLLDYLNVKDAIICGVSVGGLIAQGISKARPDLVRALILCDTGHIIGNDDLWNARIEAVESKGIEPLAEGILERWFSPAYRREDNPDFAGYRNMLVRTTAQGYAGTSAAIRDTDYTEVARFITVPTLCLVGDQDGATPPELNRELSNLIAESRFEIIEGAGHIPSIEQPGIMLGLIKGFLQQVESADEKGNDNA